MASAYRRDVDGLRGVAVLSVLLFHAASVAFPGGFVGVDIFFVISGFVIAAGIYPGMVDKTFSYSDFYARRARRILPAAIAVILSTLLIARLLYYPPAFNDVLQSGLAATLSYSNLFFWKTTNYFAPDALLRPLLHTWSLSVEEQFYVFLPPFLYLAARFRRGVTLAMIVVVAAASFGLSFYLMDRGPTANFYLLPTRAWELLLGVLIAVVPRAQANGRAGYVIYCLASAGLVCPLFFYDDSTPFPGYNALLPCVATALVIYLNPSRHPVRQLLESRYLVFFGLISYSLYLIHWPVIVFIGYVKLDQLSALEILAAVAISVLLATASWKFVEQPFRHLPLKGRGKYRILAGATVALVLSAGVCSIGFLDAPAIAQSNEESNWRQGRCFFLGAFEASKWNEDGCRLSEGKGPKALLWGDSLAAHYAPGVEADAAAFGGRIYQYTAAGCPPVLAYYSYARRSCSSFNANALQIIDAGQFDTVILSARWIDLRTRGLEQLKGTLDELSKRKLRVYVIGQSPIYPTDVRALYYFKGNHSTDASWRSVVKPSLNDALRTTVDSLRNARITFIDPHVAICGPPEACPYVKDGKFLLFDSAHYTDFGSRFAVKSYFPLRNGSSW